MDRRSVLVAGCLGAVALAALSGCTGDDPPHVGIAATAMPTRLEECNHISVEGDPGLGAGFHYDEGARHAFGESARLVVCEHPWRSGWEREGDVHALTADDARVTITPVAVVPRDGTVEVRVAVAGPVGVSGTSMDSGGAGWGGPSILTDDEAWWFGPWGDDAWD
jgi:hypothetical protein